MIGVCTDITERKQAEETIRSLLRISERLNSTLDMNALLDILVQEAMALVGAESGVAGLHAPGEGMRSQKHFRKGVPSSALSTPILSNDGQVVGFFEIHNKEGGFTEADRKTLLAVSHSASIAIQNAIAYRRIAQAEISMRESERTQRLLAEIGAMGGDAATTANGATIDGLLQGILDRVATELQASRCGWSDIDPEAGQMIVRKDVHTGYPSLTGVHDLSRYAEHMVEDSQSGRPTVICDLSTDPRTAQHFEDYEQIGVRSYIHVPLHREGRWVGSLWAAGHLARSWSKGETELLHAVANRVWQVLEQWRVSAALRDSEERFARFMEHLPGLAWIKDLKGRYVFANTAAERAFRRSREQLYGRTDEEVFPPETAVQFRENDDRAAASESGIQTMETLEQSDGVHHSLVHKFPIRGRNGAVGWVGGMAIDITERVRAEDALRESEQRYRAVVESQAEMVCRFRPDGQILFVNGAYARATGRTREELEGSDLWRFVAAEDRASVEAMLHSLTPDAPEVRIENRFETVDGERWTLWTNRALAFDANGTVLEAQSTGIDITDRKRAEVALQRANEALRRANADLEQFAYSASHDLREPIRNISLTAEILATRHAHLLDQTALQHLSLVTSGAKRMDMLVRDLLTYTHSIDPDHEEILPEATDAGVALEKAISDLSTAILESNAVITAGTLPKVRLWEVQLQQLFQNLISNAIKYRSDAEDPRIHIEAVPSGGEWIVAVHDNGMGIAPEHRERVFGIFKRLHGAGKYPGTGIGLAICKRIVERHGGRIWVESREGNRGSTFFFTLPAAVAE
jgi:PAS domain S-box-containing protein